MRCETACAIAMSACLAVMLLLQWFGPKRMK